MPTVDVYHSESRQINIGFQRPYGYRFRPFILASGDGVEPFAVETEEQFHSYITSCGNRSVFDANKRSSYRYYLQYPNAKPMDTTTYSKAQEANHKSRALKDFTLQEDQLYRQADEKRKLETRYVACTYDAFNIIVGVHTQLHHAGVKKTHERVHDDYYGITEENVKWVLARCNVCALQAANKAKSVPTPILSDRILDRLQIDLVDMRSQQDGQWKWIMQAKDHFSHYIWLWPLVDKSSASVAEKMDAWFGHNGFPQNLCCDNGTEFKGELLKLTAKYGIKVINGSAYHPQSQGSVEAANKTLKWRLSALQASLGTKKWAVHMTELATAINTTRSSSLERTLSPFQVWFGHKPHWLSGRGTILSGRSLSLPSPSLNNEMENQGSHSSSPASSSSEYNTSRETLPQGTGSYSSSISSMDGNLDDNLEIRTLHESESSLPDVDLDSTMELALHSSPELFTRDVNRQELAQRALELTELEARVAERNQAQSQKLVNKACEVITPLAVGSVATLRVHPKIRLGLERFRLPVRILEARNRRQYILMSEHGRLRGLHSHSQLNPLLEEQAQMIGGNIPHSQKQGEKTITLSKAVSMYNSRKSVGAAQRAGRKRASSQSRAPVQPPPREESPEYLAPRRKGEKPLSLPPPLTTRARSRALATPERRRARKEAFRGRQDA